LEQRWRQNAQRAIIPHEKGVNVFRRVWKNNDK